MKIIIVQHIWYLPDFYRWFATYLVLFYFWMHKGSHPFPVTPSKHLPQGFEVFFVIVFSPSKCLSLYSCCKVQSIKINIDYMNEMFVIMQQKADYHKICSNKHFEFSWLNHPVTLSRELHMKAWRLLSLLYGAFLAW